MNTPFQWTKQIASHFGGTRNRWSSRGRRRSATGRGTLAVPPRDRHRADDLRGGRDRRSDPLERHHPKTGGRHLARLHLYRREGGGSPGGRSTSNALEPRQSITTAGSRPRGPGCRGKEPARLRTPTTLPWELYNVARTSRRRTIWPRKCGKARTAGGVVWARRPVRRSAAGRAR